MRPADGQPTRDNPVEAAVKFGARLAISVIYPVCEALFCPPRADLSRLPPMHRILVIQRDFLGDALFTTPMLRALRKLYPAAAIDVLVRPCGQEVLTGNPHIDSVWVEGPSLVRRDRLREYVGFWQLALQLRRQRYDLVLNLTKGKAFAHALLAAVTGALVRIGIRTRERAGFVCLNGFPLFHNIEVPTKPNQHLIDYFLDTVRVLGSNSQDRRMELTVGETDRLYAAAFLQKMEVNEGDPVVVIHPGSNRPQNQIAADRTARICTELWQRHRAKVLLIGIPGERNRLERIAAEAPDPKPVLVVDFSLKQLAAFLKCCDLFISGDSGPLRIAEIAGTPSISLFGSANPANTRPLEEFRTVLTPPLTCCPCYEFTVQAERTFERCPVRCIDLIPIEDILRAAAVYLPAQRLRRRDVRLSVVGLGV